MSIATKAASTNTQISGTWSTPTNAYGTSSDDQYATHTQNSRNGTAEIEYGFAAFSSAEIPDGATINSVKVVAEAKVSQTIGSVIGVTIENPAGTAVGSEQTTNATTDTVIQSVATSIPTLTDLRNATVISRLFYDRANDNTSETVSIDYTYIEVDYTASIPNTNAIQQNPAVITGVAQTPSDAISGTLETGSATGAAINASFEPMRDADAEVAAATGAAADTTGEVVANLGAATATGASADSTTVINATLEASALLGAALNASGDTGLTTFDAEVAVATAQALVTGSAIAASLEVAKMKSS